MVTTYDMASGNLISSMEEPKTGAPETPEWRQPTVSCPCLALQEIGVGPARDASRIPPDLIAVDIHLFLEQQR
jgi:hypothetical protein